MPCGELKDNLYLFWVTFVLIRKEFASNKYFHDTELKFETLKDHSCMLITLYSCSPWVHQRIEHKKKLALPTISFCDIRLIIGLEKDMAVLIREDSDLFQCIFEQTMIFSHKSKLFLLLTQSQPFKNCS